MTRRFRLARLAPLILLAACGSPQKDVFIVYDPRHLHDLVQTIPAQGLSVGGQTTCISVLDTCWGRSRYGQCGDGASSEAGAVKDTTFVDGVAILTVGVGLQTRQLDCGAYHSCAVYNDGQVDCWGRLNGVNSDIPTKVIDSGVVAIATSETSDEFSGDHEFRCVLLNDGTVQCWGDNAFGQLGNGTFVSASSAVPVSGLSGVTAIAAGESHACAILGSGDLRCWGDNSVSQLGVGYPLNRSAVPVDTYGFVPYRGKATAIAAGGHHTCAVIGDQGDVYCWGANAYGQTGQPTAASRTPLPVKYRVKNVEQTLTNVTALAAGLNFSCALHADRTVSCWGENHLGQKGHGTKTTNFDATPSAVLLPGNNKLESVIQIAAGGDTACALLPGRSHKCWGDGAFGVLTDGNGDTKHASAWPVP